VIQETISLNYEPASEPPHIFVKWLFRTPESDYLDASLITVMQVRVCVTERVCTHTHTHSLSLTHSHPRSLSHTLTHICMQIPWREADPPNHHDDKVDSDQ